MIESRASSPRDFVLQSLLHVLQLLVQAVVIRQAPEVAAREGTSSEVQMLRRVARATP